MKKKQYLCTRFRKQQIINLNKFIEREKIMALKRNCEHLSFKTAKGSYLRFIGAAKADDVKVLIAALNFPLHIEIKGEDVIAYYDEDFYLDDLDYIKRTFGARLKHFLEKGKVVKCKDIVLADYLPSVLPLQDNMTWEEIYNRSLESTTRDESGQCYTTGQNGENYDADKIPAVVKTYSINEYRVNGYFS